MQYSAIEKFSCSTILERSIHLNISYIIVLFVLLLLFRPFSVVCIWCGSVLIHPVIVWLRYGKFLYDCLWFLQMQLYWWSSICSIYYKFRVTLMPCTVTFVWSQEISHYQINVSWRDYMIDNFRIHALYHKFPISQSLFHYIIVWWYRLCRHSTSVTQYIISHWRLVYKNNLMEIINIL